MIIQILFLFWRPYKTYIFLCKSKSMKPAGSLNGTYSNVIAVRRLLQLSRETLYINVSYTRNLFQQHKFVIEWTNNGQIV